MRSHPRPAHSFPDTGTCLYGSNACFPAAAKRSVESAPGFPHRAVWVTAQTRREKCPKPAWRWRTCMRLSCPDSCTMSAHYSARTRHADDWSLKAGSETACGSAVSCETSAANPLTIGAPKESVPLGGRTGMLTMSVVMDYTHERVVPQCSAAVAGAPSGEPLQLLCGADLGCRGGACLDRSRPLAR